MNAKWKKTHEKSDSGNYVFTFHTTTRKKKKTPEEKTKKPRET